MLLCRKTPLNYLRPLYSWLIDGIKTAESEFYNVNGTFPSNNASAGLASAGSISGDYVTSVNIGLVRGQIRARYGGSKANSRLTSGVMLVFSAITHTGSIEWQCKSD
jgi:type IV pilus assembly protein PilA